MVSNYAPPPQHVVGDYRELGALDSFAARRRQEFATALDQAKRQFDGLSAADRAALMQYVYEQARARLRELGLGVFGHYMYLGPAPTTPIPSGGSVGGSVATTCPHCGHAINIQVTP
jgi:hypothetical protein